MTTFFRCALAAVTASVLLVAMGAEQPAAKDQEKDKKLTLFDGKSLDGWKKIIDYKDKTTDEGFYTYNPNLQFVVVAGSVFSTGTTTLQPDVTYQATITRDAAGVTTGYIDRVQEWQFTDTAGVATLQGVTAPVHFFIDDNAT